MFNRLCLGALLSACLLGTLTGCNSSNQVNGLTITPASVPLSGVGNTAQLTATGQYGSSGHHTYQNVTDQVTWTSGSASFATVSSSGLVTAVAAGTTQITATIAGFGGTLTATSTVTVTVSSCTTNCTTSGYTALTVTPSSQSVAVPGQTSQFLAFATTAAGGSVNVTSSAVWYSSNPQVATVKAGLATGVGQGTTTITAVATNTDGTSVFAQASFSVTGGGSSTTLTALSVLPATQTVAVPGQTAQFDAFATTAAGGTVNVSSTAAWSSSDTQVATVSAAGLVTAVGQGTTTITAIATNSNSTVVEGQATFTVTASGSGSSSSYTALSIIPSAQSVALPGQTSQFIAIATTAAGNTVNVTSTVTWSSSSTQVATIISSGLATAVGKGTTTITAIASNSATNVVTATATFTVIAGDAEQVTALSIIPGSLALSSTGQTAQFTAIGTSGSTGLTEDLTASSQITWSSSIPSIATISPAGLAKGVSPGTTYITAEFSNPATGTSPASVVESNVATITVSVVAAPEPLLSITVLPNSITTDNLFGNGQFLAYGTFSTSPTVQDITNGISPRTGFPATEVNWISDAPFIFPVNSGGTSGGDAGLVTADGSGTGVIYVTAANPDGTLVYSPPVTFNCPYKAPTYDTTTTPATLTDPGTCNDLTIANGLLVTLTVFNAGVNTTDWLVTAPSATGTADVIHCGPGSSTANLGASVCEATYPVGTIVTLTAPAGAGKFGGWSYNCTPTTGVTAAGPNTCQVKVGDDLNSTNPTSNVSVGAIFN